MDAYALVLNAGSSSLKFCVYRRGDVPGPHLHARGQIDGIGTAPRLRATSETGAEVTDRRLSDVRHGRDAVHALAEWLQENVAGSALVGIGHRVVHGGAKYVEPCRVTPDVLEDLRGLVPLAPLHQPFAIDVIETMGERIANAPQIACFDTSFHCSADPVAKLVPLTEEVRETGVQRFGFHGLSYEYIASVLPEVAPEIADGRALVAHLGSGASICALRERRSVDTTFGLTALDGLCMGTRPGSLDPGIVLYLFQVLGRSASEVEELLYEKSGLAGISGISGDVRVLLASKDPRARLALDYFVYQAAKEFGALASVLGGVDALVFTGGIGENSAEMRARICERCAWLGVALDGEANRKHGPRISKPGSRVSAWVIRTDEERMIARHMGTLLNVQWLR